MRKKHREWVTIELHDGKPRPCRPPQDKSETVEETCNNGVCPCKISSRNIIVNMIEFNDHTLSLKNSQNKNFSFR